MAQLEARVRGTDEVEGSSPSGSKKNYLTYTSQP